MKGIVAKPMPKHWYNERTAAESDDPVDARICASKKPYFMIYRYPELRSQYRSFQKEASRKHKMLHKSRISDTTDHNFTEWYNRFCPVQYGRGVVNRICEVCENYFSPAKYKDDSRKFDFSILKTGVDYSRHTRDQVALLCNEYTEQLQSLNSLATADEDTSMQRAFLRQSFIERCAAICPSEIELCDVIVDICYKRESSKHFAWEMCGEQMVANVLRNSGGTVLWPKATSRGSVIFGGKRFKLEELNLEENFNERYCIERAG